MCMPWVSDPHTELVLQTWPSLSGGHFLHSHRHKRWGGLEVGLALLGYILGSSGYCMYTGYWHIMQHSPWSISKVYRLWTYMKVHRLSRALWMLFFNNNNNTYLCLQPVRWMTLYKYIGDTDSAAQLNDLKQLPLHWLVWKFECMLKIVQATTGKTFPLHYVAGSRIEIVGSPITMHACLLHCGRSWQPHAQQWCMAAAQNSSNCHYFYQGKEGVLGNHPHWIHHWVLQNSM